MGASFDTIVIGLGGVGSAAAYALASQNVRTLGIDRFNPPHARGSSHGETRIIRKAYFEHPSYVPLLLRAYELWQQIECVAEQKLFHRTGLLEIGPSDGIVVPGVLSSAALHGLDIETMSMSEARRRFPGIDGDASWRVLLERDAGYLNVEECVATYLKHARLKGAELKTDELVVDWQSRHGTVVVRTDKTVYHARSLVVAAGPWASETLSRYQLPLRVVRKHLYWYQGRTPGYRQDQGFPCYFYETPHGYFYGFPELDRSGAKVARHSGGDVAQGPVDGLHPADADDRNLVEIFLKQNMPDMILECCQTRGCYYTMTPDENFIVDCLPDAPNVTVIAGLSGHGFKFTSVLGEIAALLSTGYHPPCSIDFLSLRRFEPSP
ncbi:MAG: N-methyl-L-tryptophan oxidase [Planctomycetes bacterium]|nr:N-methyl-L-tryptophan oxidase [Planctomycetota bacterium]